MNKKKLGRKISVPKIKGVSWFNHPLWVLRKHKIAEEVQKIQDNAHKRALEKKERKTYAI